MIDPDYDGPHMAPDTATPPYMQRAPKPIFMSEAGKL